MRPEVHAFSDEATFTVTYPVRDPSSRKLAVIDSVLDFDYASGCTDTRSADAVIAFIREKGFGVGWLLETHVHADHLSAWETTVGAQKRLNRHVGGGRGRADSVRMRTERDAQLAMPRLIIPSLQVNMRAGKMPEPEANGTTYLKVPIDTLGR